MVAVSVSLFFWYGDDASSRVSLACFYVFPFWTESSWKLVSFAREQSRLLLVCEGGAKVLLTNSPQKKRPGPKGVHAGNLYSFAHQAYWGFRFLAEKRGILWRKVLAATTIAQVTRVGRACWRPAVLARAGYGAAGQMERLREKPVAMQVLAAKSHRRYPRSNRPSSEDRRMIFLGIALAAAVWEIDFETALRKLAEAKRGIRHMVKEVHRYDRFMENVRVRSIVWAEPAGNYFFPEPSPDGKWELMQELPCKVPDDWQGGFIIHGIGPSGPQSTFSRTLPLELQEWLEKSERQANEAKRPAKKKKRDPSQQPRA